jgi:hypothetical protein
VLSGGKEVSVKEKLKGLEALQTVDLQILDLQKAGEAYPKRLAELDAELAGARSALEADRARLNENEKLRRDKDAEIVSEKDKTKKWESRLAEMRTTREYAALAREIDISKKAILNLEEENKALVEVAQTIRNSLVEKEAELRRREDGSAAERSELSEKIGSLANQIRELTEKRGEASKAADPELVGRYEFVRKKKGQGVVPVINGICKGCKMRLPPQLQNILRAGATIETCPSCQRLIYSEEAMKD